ncbi:VOC family protein [uncultured Enorma sp.]|uniref:VOC family protein n=1 Tax=uncultured Enorma sp. TaxID=1714346 RepID=UPI0026DB2D41|nr:VOC family protein [uncultured Enorma sp.]
MRIEHAALYVNDLEGARAFFETYFGVVPNDGYHNPKTGLRTYFLTFGEGDAEGAAARLEIMTRSGLEDLEKSTMRTGWTHLAFSLGSKSAVDELTARLKTDGYEVLSGPRTTGDGYYESSVLGFEGVNIEIIAYGCAEYCLRATRNRVISGKGSMRLLRQLQIDASLWMR